MLQWVTTDPIGKTYQIDLKFNNAKTVLEGWKQQIETIRMHDPGSQAVRFLEDMRFMERTFGV